MGRVRFGFAAGFKAATEAATTLDSYDKAKNAVSSRSEDREALPYFKTARSQAAGQCATRLLGCIF